MPYDTEINLSQLKNKLSGELYFDNAHKIMYATDASAYREVPVGVAYPRNKEDLKQLILFARDNDITLIPRAAGTSLAGQVVGNGLVVDMSKYFTKILEINEQEHWVRVEPGVILDELNREIKQYGLFFGPETSTSSRCNIGGMVGNNSCGAHSLIYGSTRDHLISVKALLSDASEVEFRQLSREEFREKMTLENLEGNIYRNIREILSDEENQRNIISEFPDPSIKRRNTGYAIDLLMQAEPFTGGEPFNFCKLIAGSEGTLALLTEIKLNLVPLPPKEKALVCIHCISLQSALKANLTALKHNPVSVELMDKAILDLTKENINQNKNRFFVNGDPAAILIVEFAEESQEKIKLKAEAMEADMRADNLGYHFPIITGKDINKVWELRKAGLGVLSNMPGDAKPVPVVEDTAVNPEALPQYIEEFNSILEKHNLSCVYYAHIGTGELHLRPVLNLKDPKDVMLFHTIALETAKLVKKHKGSLSGEHGDGRLRGEFIPLMIGEKNYSLLISIKQTWDPFNIFNNGKIIETPPMNTMLRYETGAKVREIDTYYDFEHEKGVLRAVEKCNGSGDCRKLHYSSGGMCPSYQATLDEKNSTRARANILREFLTNSPKKDPFNHKDIYNVMDLCLGCKLCKSECPSSVDMAKFKTEFLQHWYNTHPIRIRTYAIAYIDKINRLALPFSGLYNLFAKNYFLSWPIKKLIGFAPQRSLPQLHGKSLRKWARKNLPELNKLTGHNGTVSLFVDEFTNTNDIYIGVKAISLLCMLGYKVELHEHEVSARTFISKGLLKKARKIIDKNINAFWGVLSNNHPLIGIEPSTILSFRDEYPELCSSSLREKARSMAPFTMLIDEFIVQEFEKGKINKIQFTDSKKEILYHGHCQQKALIGTDVTKKMLGIPSHFCVTEIPSGCCGMAGSFGFEKEHYDFSMKVGELVLLPTIRNAGKDTVIAASGTSCRHQIKDGTGKTALHPVEIMFDAMSFGSSQKD
jgi:FAD/FMN-containing dehydrogenase/Fe-S oxidoreductase